MFGDFVLVPYFIETLSSSRRHMQRHEHAHLTQSLFAVRSRERNPVGTRFSLPVQTGSEVPPSLQNNRCWVFFLGGKTVRAVVKHPTPSLKKK